MQSRICETQQMQVDLQCNSDARSDFCILDSSQMVIVSIHWGQGFRYCSHIMVHYYYHQGTLPHFFFFNLFLCISSPCFYEIYWFYITSKIQTVFSAINSSTERFSENIWHEICIMILSTICIWNLFVNFWKNLVRCHKCYWDFMQRSSNFVRF